MFRPIPLNKPIGLAYTMDGDDVLKTKKALIGLGHYKVPDHGLNPYPDRAMIDGLKGFQRSRGLREDGIMRPDGPTAAQLGRFVAQPSPQKRSPVTSPSNSPPALQVPRLDLLDASPRPKPALAPYRTALAPPTRTADRRPPPPERQKPPSRSGPIPGGGRGNPGAGDRETQVVWLAPAVRMLQLLGRLLPGVGAGIKAQRLLEEAGKRRKREKLTVPVEPPRPMPPMAGMDMTDPPPPVPGLEPPKDKDRPPAKTVFPADSGIKPLDLSRPIPQTTGPTIFVLPIPPEELRKFGQVVENRRGNAATQAEIERIQSIFERLHPGWTHIGGGQNREKGGLLEEFHIPSVADVFGGDGRKGGTFVDLTFKTPTGKLIHIQTADVDRKTGKVTQRELNAADRIRRSRENVDVILIPKGAQIEKFLRFPKR